jgi:hypothetical protein
MGVSITLISTFRSFDTTMATNTSTGLFRCLIIYSPVFLSVVATAISTTRLFVRSKYQATIILFYSPNNLLYCNRESHNTIFFEAVTVGRLSVAEVPLTLQPDPLNPFHYHKNYHYPPPAPLLLVD